MAETLRVQGHRTSDVEETGVEWVLRLKASPQGSRYYIGILESYYIVWKLNRCQAVTAAHLLCTAMLGPRGEVGKASANPVSGLKGSIMLHRINIITFLFKIGPFPWSKVGGTYSQCVEPQLTLAGHSVQCQTYPSDFLIKV